MFPPEGRERFLRLMGPSGPKVLRFDSGHRPLRVVVAAGAAVKKGGAPDGAGWDRLRRRVVQKGLCSLCSRGRYRRFAAMSIKSALRDCLPAGYCHPERSEGSRYKPLMRQSVVNTDRREGATSSGFSPFGTFGTTFPARGSVGRQKESALMGRLGTLFRPTCTSYAGCAQWDNNPRGTISPISISRHHAAKTSPSGGSGALAPIGVHFLALQARLYGFPRPQGGSPVFPRATARL